MSFIIDIARLHKPTAEEVEARWKVYQQHTRSLEGKLPAGAFAYASSEQHSNYAHNMCPHDGWLDRLVIEEPAAGRRSEKRSIIASIVVLAAGHDGRIRFTYPNVRSYLVNVPIDFEAPPVDVGHGDWLADEIQLSERGLVLHDILFSRGGQWRIEADDVLYQWIPLIR